MNPSFPPSPEEKAPQAASCPATLSPQEENPALAADPTAVSAALKADGYTPLIASPRRRRSRRPIVTRPGAEEIAERLENLSRRAAPTFDYFIFSIAAGAILAVGFLLDTPAILFFGVIAAPLLTPWLGISLALAAGEARYLGQTLGGFFTSSLLILLISLLAGFVARLLPPTTYQQAAFYAHLWWPELLLLVLGSLLFPLTFHQSEEKPLLPGLLLSYTIYLPLSAAGFGLASAQSGIFPQALLVTAAHLAISLALVVSVFYYLGYRPLEMHGYAWGAAALLLGLSLAGGILGLGSLALPSLPAVPASTSTQTPAFSPTPNLLVLLTPPSATASSTLSLSTPIPSTRAAPTLSPTPSAIPTPVYGKILSRGGDGAIIRQSPSGPAITTVQNDYVVEILPDKPVRAEDGVDWIHVRVKTSTQVIEGWVQADLVVTPQP